MVRVLSQFYHYMFVVDSVWISWRQNNAIRVEMQDN